MTLEKEQKGILLAFSTALVSGLAIFINKFGVKVITPDIFTGLKNITVALFILMLIVIGRDWYQFKKLSKKDFVLLFLIGLIGGSIPFILFFKGLSLTLASKASFIHKTLFIYATLGAIIFLKEKVNFKLALGIFIFLLANILLLKFTPQEINKGDGLVLLATLFWAGEQVLSKHALKRLTPKIVAWGRLFFGSGLIILYWILTNQIHLLGQLNSEQIIWVLITAGFLTAYVLTWYSALKYIRVSQATAILTLGGPITILLNFLFRAKPLLAHQIYGFTLFLLGFVLIGGLRAFKKLFISSFKYVRR
jgi:drug/metabolite transporter (DMT)-like permease